MDRRKKVKASWKNGSALDEPEKFAFNASHTKVNQYIHYTDGSSEVVVTFKFSKEYNGEVPGL